MQATQVEKKSIQDCSISEIIHYHKHQKVLKMVEVHESCELCVALDEENKRGSLLLTDGN